MKAPTLILLTAFAPLAMGMPPVPPPAGVRAPIENVSYAFAQVLRVDPVYERVILLEPEERCEEDVVYERIESPSPARAAVGAVIGGIVGNQVGSGSGRRAATAAGAVAGAAIGHASGQRGEAEHLVRPGCRIVEVEREERRLAGYDVEYRYKGDVFMSRMPHDPGDRLRIRVAIAPADDYRGGGR